MQTIELKGKKWLIDLDWEILPNESNPKQEAKDAAKKNNYSYGLLVEYENQYAIGLSKKNSKLPSASYYLALANQEARNETSEMENYPDWIVIEEMGDEKYWMAVINKGIPSPQFDRVFDITTIKEKIVELLVNDSYSIFSPCGEIQTIFDGIKYIEPKTLNELTEEVKVKTKFTKLRGLPNSIIIGAFVLMFAGVFVLIGSTFLEDYNLKQRSELLQRQQMEEARLAQEAYQQRLRDYNSQIEKMRKDAVDNVVIGLSGNPNNALNAWYQAVGNLEFGTHGWNMEEIACIFNPQIEMKSNCTINFARTGLTTNRMLLQDFPDAVIQGDKANVTRLVLADEKIFSKPSDDILTTLPYAKNWGFDMISQLQLLKIAGVDFSVKPSSDIVFTPPTKPLSPQEIASGVTAQPSSPISIGISQGELIIKSDNFDLLRELADNVDFSAVGVKKTSFKLQNLGSISWEVVMTYYLKNGDGTIAASDSTSLQATSVPQKELQERR